MTKKTTEIDPFLSKMTLDLVALVKTPTLGEAVKYTVAYRKQYDLIPSQLL